MRFEAALELSRFSARGQHGRHDARGAACLACGMLRVRRVIGRPRQRGEPPAAPSVPIVGRRATILTRDLATGSRRARPRIRYDVAFVVGTRPELIKIAPVVDALQRRGAAFSIVHTGQHYAYELDGIFFKELGLPKP